MNLKKSTILLLIFLTITPIFAQKNKNALVLWRSGKYESAVNICLSEIKTLPESSFAEIMDSYTVLTWSLLSLKRYDDVVKYGTEAYKKSMRDWRIIASLGEAYFNLGNDKEALFLFEKYIEFKSSGEKAGYVYYLMGHLFLRMEEYNRADIALSMAISLKPLNAKWWSRLGYVREQAQDYQNAKIAYNKSLSINPSLVDAERGMKRVNKYLGI